jgi:thioredoxin reductase (NADPH)
MEEALYLTRFASRVHVIVRRDVLRASPIMQERAKTHEKIEFHWHSVVEEIRDVAAGTVTGVQLKDARTGAATDLNCAGVFVAIGLKPNTDLFAGQLDLDENGYLVPVGAVGTRVPGVFVAGDVADQVYRQAVTAAGTGCAAAIEAERYLAAIGD